MFLVFFYYSNLRSSIIVRQFEPEIDTLEDAAAHLPGVYIPMFDVYGQDGYLSWFTDILGPDVYAKVEQEKLSSSITQEEVRTEQNPEYLGKRNCQYEGIIRCLKSRISHLYHAGTGLNLRIY